MAERTIAQLVPVTPTSDGAGVKLYRSIGSPLQENLDPFLLLDEFASEDANDYIAGFPDHPHRGFETVTYMLDGAMRHEDNTGSGGTLRSGGVQWMTAGRGVIHSEMPEQREGLMRGFQLWVNLPARLKMTDPRYQNLEPEEVPELVQEDGVKVRIIAGEVAGVKGAVSEIYIEPMYLDVALPAGTAFAQPVPEGHTAFVYVADGQVAIGGDRVPKRTLAVLSDGERVTVAATEAPARLLIIAGSPINEPIVRYGPFVMNTLDEIKEAVTDYQSGRF